jgi:hypothetical protein
MFLGAFVDLGAPAAFAKRTEKEMRIPTDDQALNAFAGEYNRFVEKLKQGLVDVKAWKKVVQAWERLVG